MTIPIANTNWFENIFGVKEDATNRDSVIKKFGSGLKISNIPNKYEFGKFRTVTLEKLRLELEKDIKRTKYKVNKTIKIKIDYSINVPIQFQIGELSDTDYKDYKNCVFQCESQLNCLNGNKSDLITNYVGINGEINQGKAMSVLCAAGTYYRKYLHADINITDKLNTTIRDAWSIDTGGDKIVMNSSQEQHIEDYLEYTIRKNKIDENIYKHVEVGIQENVEIVLKGKIDNGDKLYLDTNSILRKDRISITQVFTCLLNSGNDELNYFHLVAQYEATLLVAAKNYINTNRKMDTVVLCIFDENISKVEQARAIKEAIISFRKYKIPLNIYITDFADEEISAIKDLNLDDELIKPFSDKEETQEQTKPKLSNSPAKKFSLTKGKTTKKEMNKKIKELVKGIKNLVKISKFTKKVDLPSKYNIEIEKCVKIIANVNEDATKKIIQTTAEKMVKKTKRKKRKYRSPTFG